MKDYLKNVVDQAMRNSDFRRVIHTGKCMQTVLMNINPGEEIGMEVHPDNEQFLVCVNGEGRAVVNKAEEPFELGDVVVVPPGAEHNFINTSDTSMKIVTIYSPPHHPAGTIHKTKAEADAAETKEG
jgi:mannose-6-phosphate isomerase-like protein (cupin superfamily)